MNAFVEIDPETKVLTRQSYKDLDWFLTEFTSSIDPDTHRESIELIYDYESYHSQFDKYFEELERQWRQDLALNHQFEDTPKHNPYDFQLLDILKAKKEYLTAEAKWQLYKQKNSDPEKTDQEKINEILKEDKEYSRISFYLRKVEAKVYGNPVEAEELDIEKAKQYPIRTLIEMHGIHYKKGFINCPFHGEDTPSCKVYEKTNSFFCFGCGEGGTVIDFKMKIDKCDFVQAVKDLQG